MELASLTVQLLVSCVSRHPAKREPHCSPLKQKYAVATHAVTARSALLSWNDKVRDVARRKTAWQDILEAATVKNTTVRCGHVTYNARRTGLQWLPDEKETRNQPHVIESMRYNRRTWHGKTSVSRQQTEQDARTVMHRKNSLVHSADLCRGRVRVGLGLGLGLRLGLWLTDILCNCWVYEASRP